MAARQSTAGAIKPYARRIRFTCRRRRAVPVDRGTEVIDIFPPAFLIRCPIAMGGKGAGSANGHGDRLEAGGPGAPMDMVRALPARHSAYPGSAGETPALPASTHCGPVP